MWRKARQSKLGVSIGGQMSHSSFSVHLNNTLRLLRSANESRLLTCVTSGLSWLTSGVQRWEVTNLRRKKERERERINRHLALAVHCGCLLVVACCCKWYMWVCINERGREPECLQVSGWMRPMLLLANRPSESALVFGAQVRASWSSPLFGSSPCSLPLSLFASLIHLFLSFLLKVSANCKPLLNCEGGEITLNLHNDTVVTQSTDWHMKVNAMTACEVSQVEKRKLFSSLFLSLSHQLSLMTCPSVPLGSFKLQGENYNKDHSSTDISFSTSARWPLQDTSGKLSSFYLLSLTLSFSLAIFFWPGPTILLLLGTKS